MKSDRRSECIVENVFFSAVVITILNTVKFICTEQIVFLFLFCRTSTYKNISSN